MHKKEAYESIDNPRDRSPPSLLERIASQYKDILTRKRGELGVFVATTWTSSMFGILGIEMIYRTSNLNAHGYAVAAIGGTGLVFAMFQAYNLFKAQK